MPAAPSRRVVAVLTAALVAMLLAVCAGTARAATVSLQADADRAGADHPALAQAVSDVDHVEHAVDLTAALPAGSQRSPETVVEDRAVEPEAHRGTSRVASVPRGPPGR